jgi:hypothetical protein
VISVVLRLVDFMDARALPGATLDVSLTVVPRFPVAPDEGDPEPEFELEADNRFAEVLSESVVTDSDGRARVQLDSSALFGRLGSMERPEVPRRAHDAIGTLSSQARFLGIRFDPRILAEDVRDGAALDHSLPADLGMAIVGHTTPHGVRLWFQLPFEPMPDHQFTCGVTTVPVNAPRLLPGPLGGAVGQMVPATFEPETRTAVVDVDGLPAGAVHDYGLSVGRGPIQPPFALVTGRFATPADAQSRVSFAFGSCHLPAVTGTPDEPDAEARRTLTHWQQLADRRDFEFLLLMGDQIYGDGIEDKWPDADAFTQYVRRYRQLWGHRPTREVLRSGATYMILDDHDVADDFGTGNLPDAKVIAAIRAYNRFQHAHNPGDGDGPPFYYDFRWGPAAFFVMDGRSHRGEGDPPTPVFGREQLTALRRWARSPETRAADIIFFVAPVPLALLPAEIIRQVSEEIAEQSGAALGVLAGLGAGLLVGLPFPGVGGALTSAAVLGAVGYEAGEEIFERVKERSMLLESDLAERWDLRENQPDLIRLLDVLFDLGNGVGEDPPRKRAVFILSGDIHAATMHAIRSLPEGAGRAHTANPVITQLSSSAISREPVKSTLWIEAVSHIDEEVDIDLKDINDLRLVTGGIDWESVAKEAIDVDDVFDEGDAEYFLDPNHDRRYLTQYAGLIMERTVGRVKVERRHPERRIYRLRLTIEGETQRLESFFDLDLDADQIVPRTHDAQFKRQRIPRTIEPFERVAAEVTMRNTGPATWAAGYALDISQNAWGVDRVPVTGAVRPDRDHTFRFEISAPSSGIFLFNARMAHGRTPFGRFTPTVRITAASGGEGGANCQELLAERRRVQQTIEQLQGDLAGASPAEKQQLNDEIREARESLVAINRRMDDLGCD